MIKINRTQGRIWLCRPDSAASRWRSRADFVKAVMYLLVL